MAAGIGSVIKYSSVVLVLLSTVAIEFTHL